MYVEDSIIISPIIFITFDLINNLYFCTFHICVCNMKHLLNKTLLTSGALASLLLSVSLTSCQDEDFGYTSEEVRAAAYDRNFIAKYGEIDPEQSWDLSSYAVQNMNSDKTRAITNSCSFFDDDPDNWLSNKIYIEDQWYYAPTSLVNSFNHYLGEGVYNRNQGIKFTLRASGGLFYIIPLFQGVSGIETDLHMVVKYNGATYDKQIWDKGQNLEKQDMGSYDWKPIGKFDDYANYGDKGEYQALYEGSTYGAKATRAKPIKCLIPKGAEINFYLHVTKGHLTAKTSTGEEHEGQYEPNLAFTNVKQWASYPDDDNKRSGKMMLLNSNFEIDQIAQERFGKTAYLIGCEDASYGTEAVDIFTSKTEKITYTPGTSGAYNGSTVDSWAGDEDMNDLVFMFIGDVPEVKDENVIKKRYLIEDLGSVADWDFNDVVIDVYQETEDGEIVSQTAYMRHKCGTTDFEVNIGHATNIFGRHQGEVQNTHYNMAEITSGASGTITKVELQPNAEGVWPWNPEANNISVRVYPETNNIDETKPNQTNKDGFSDSGSVDSDGVSSDTTDPTNQDMANSGLLVNFPERGDVPRIIAVDVDFDWSDENQDIDQSLWTFYNITASTELVDSNEAGVVSGEGRYRKGEEVTLKAIPNPGYKFKCWNNNPNDNNPNKAFSATGNESYTAIFEQGETPAQKEYVVNLKVEGTGKIRYNSTEVITTGSYTGKVNNSIRFTATTTSSQVFSYWSDANGNVVSSDATISIEADAVLTAHFVDPKTLTVIVAKEDWQYVKNDFKLYVYDNGSYSEMSFNSNTGVATKTISSDNAIIVAAIPGMGQYNVQFEWSEGGTDANPYTTQNVNNKDCTKDGDVFTGVDTSKLPTAYDNGYNITKTVNIPDQGKAITVGVTYQLFVYSALDNGDRTYQRNQQNTWGSASIDGKGRQRFLHKNSTYNLSATPTPGYSFVGWAQINDHNGTYQNDGTIGNDPILRNQINVDGTAFVSAVFRENTRRTLTLQLKNSSDTDENLEFEVNGSKAISQGNGKYTVQVLEGAQLKITATHKEFTSNSKSYVKFELSDGTILENNTATTLIYYMPSYDLTIDISNILYRVFVNVKLDGNNVDDYSNICSVTIDGNNENPAFLPEAKAVNFSVAPKSGYNFTGWAYGGYKPTETTVQGHNNPGTKTMVFDANFVTAAQKYHVTVKVNINAAGTVKIGNGPANTQVEGDYDIGSQLTLTASQANSGYAFEKWSSGAYTYTRTLDVKNATHNVDANYLAGAMIFDHPNSPIQVNGEKWSTLDYIKNVGDYKQWFNALKNFMNGKTSVKLRIYCTNDSKGTFQLVRYYGGDNGWEMNYYISGNTFTLKDGYAEVILDSGAINAITESNGLVIQRTDENNQSASFIRIIVTAN